MTEEHEQTLRVNEPYYPFHLIPGCCVIVPQIRLSHGVSEDVHGKIVRYRNKFVFRPDEFQYLVFELDRPNFIITEKEDYRGKLTEATG